MWDWLWVFDDKFLNISNVNILNIYDYILIFIFGMGRVLEKIKKLYEGIKFIWLLICVVRGIFSII